jgi:hypothetical protein
MLLFVDFRAKAPIFKRFYNEGQKLAFHNAVRLAKVQDAQALYKVASRACNHIERFASATPAIKPLYS